MTTLLNIMKLCFLMPVREPEAVWQVLNLPSQDKNCRHTLSCFSQFSYKNRNLTLCLQKASCMVKRKEYIAHMTDNIKQDTRISLCTRTHTRTENGDTKTINLSFTQLIPSKYSGRITNYWKRSLILKQNY